MRKDKGLKVAIAGDLVEFSPRKYVVHTDVEPMYYQVRVLPYRRVNSSKTST